MGSASVSQGSKTEGQRTAVWRCSGLVFSTLKSQGVKRTGERDRQEIFGESQVRRTSTGARKGERDKRDGEVFTVEEAGEVYIQDHREVGQGL